LCDQVLPAEIKKLRRLEVLRISHNLLSMVPGEMGKMTALIALNLSGLFSRDSDPIRWMWTVIVVLCVSAKVSQPVCWGQEIE